MWVWFAAEAFGVGGALVGPVGPPVLSKATQLSIAPNPLGTTFILTAEVSVATDTVALLWPMEGIVPSSVIPVNPVFYSRIEPFTRGRVERFTCDELYTVTHWPTPPGCASYPIDPVPPPTGESAAASVGIDPVYADVDVEAGVVQPYDLPQWLIDRGLVLDPAYDLVLQEYVAAGFKVLAIRPDGPMAAGTWLPPVEFSVPTSGPHILPLRLGAAIATTEHQLVLYGVAPEEEGALTVANYARGFIEDDCMLPAGVSAEQWWSDGVEALRPGPLPSWLLVHADRPDSCQPCVSDPLEVFEIAQYGGGTEPEDTMVSRIEMPYLPTELIDDPEIAFDGESADVQLRWIATDTQLEFVFATCGEEDEPENPGTCPQIHVQRAGAPGWLSVVPLVGLAGLLLTRRRWVAAGALVLLLSAPSARAADRRPADRTPRYEAHAGLAVWGTDRLVPDGIEGGAPYALNPYLSIEGRWAAFGWSDGANVGPLVSLSGWTGNAAPGSQTSVVGFTLLEPSFGVDFRHGRLRERSLCPLARYGASFVVPIVGNSVTPTEAYVAGALHGGIGAWLGRGLLRPSVELRARVLPRTDGFETTFHENVGMPGWMFFPGTANLWIVVGLARL